MSTAVTFTGTAAATTVVSAVPITLDGYNVREAAGTPAAALLEIFDNASAATGTLLATIPLVASAGGPVMFTRPIRAKNGVVTKVTTGTVSGSLYLD